MWIWVFKIFRIKLKYCWLFRPTFALYAIKNWKLYLGKNKQKGIFITQVADWPAWLTVRWLAVGDNFGRWRELELRKNPHTRNELNVFPCLFAYIISGQEVQLEKKLHANTLPVFQEQRDIKDSFIPCATRLLNE